MSEEKIDTFVCVHRRDVDYLLKLVLSSYRVNFLPKGNLILITNDLPYLRQFVDCLNISDKITLFDDKEWLSKQELDLPGWYRQQIIKLRAYEFCETRNFCNLGADVILLQPFAYSDLVRDDVPILHFTRHLWPDRHYSFERERVKQVAQILHVNPERASQYVDFINDLFCFNRDFLIDLNQYLTKLYGTESYYTLLKGLNTSSDQNKFGEWTLYSVYLLDYLKENMPMKNTQDGFLYQVHSRLLMKFFQFNTKAVHFVSKDFDVNYIKQQIQRRNLPLGQYL